MSKKIDTNAFINSTEPVSRVFGLDRGKPLDRYYIDNFLREESNELLKRESVESVLEVAESTYSSMLFPGNDEKPVRHDILRFDKGQDLTNISTLPIEKYDVFICTQTFNFIYNIDSAIKGAKAVLRSGGVLLATVAGSITQISRYDMDRWGHYWGITDLSAKKLFESVFGEGHVQVRAFGNVAASVAFLQGLAQEDIEDISILDYMDPDYQMIIGIKAVKQ